ncbi:hypothetical protein TWF569_010998 [Orbilia oligospora]|uniref:ABC transporter domain-containing protein n=1 Tax=Orbilia oligospora TaxID=2813651 RepID=A0A7C8NQB1_ORBOL|nr:hypothetical protein TWF103_004280 [Orbilia oligospora]KAF3080283.1 hypothetical protein TWF706_002790 [Orbilia oligospora]KAF3102006.1 hypothetical protein TWF102_004735 [Orbilia oligospora]KAF3125839.1 hypothetical protein TWF703_010659 [Orbilia oligospora]KAF3132128.1 hypothetical protein TWF569_010998 [Orbilia oligospora]
METTKPESQHGTLADVEALADAHLLNDTVQTLSFDSLTVTVPVKGSKEEKKILDNVSGIIRAGEMVALMGPSGSGKTTMLNLLAGRTHKIATSGKIFVNGGELSKTKFRKISSYVEQEDHLIGSLTARETLDFSARLALSNSITAAERKRRIDALLASFGLVGNQTTLVGTPIRRGLSGGQKRRLGVASSLITCPKILFLDEPTSGLDSAASYEVMSYLKNVCKSNKLIVICSIHQPSTSTFNLFDSLYLLSQGKMCYSGSLPETREYFASIGHEIPHFYNPAEYLLDIINVDFAQDKQAASEQLQVIQSKWNSSEKLAAIKEQIVEAQNGKTDVVLEAQGKTTQILIPVVLLHRSFVKSYRDVFAYGVRIAMYMGLAIMMGTVWLRLSTHQESIQPFINAIFFGSAFMSFMAVAYIPAFLEDRATFIKERNNGLYGPTSFIIANFFIGVPYLFLIAILFSVVSYWLSNFYPSGTAFLYWVMWLFLDLLAAESLVVFVSSLFPIFVVSLALTAFLNGLWMSVGGFLVSPRILNVFWKYWARYIDYQSYVFQGMMVNEFSRRNYECGEGCHCMYSTPLEDQCMIDGDGVLAVYGYKTGKNGEWAGILVAIIVGYRLLSWIVLKIKRT